MLRNTSTTNMYTNLQYSMLCQEGLDLEPMTNSFLIELRRRKNRAEAMNLNEDTTHPTSL